jgi:mono/diheme cytochrome c family protein
LRDGYTVLHGIAAGPMSPVVHGHSALSESDVIAIATYFADIDHAGDRSASVDPAVARAMSYAPLGTGQDFDADARLYTVACASCHYNSGRAPLAVRPDLALNSAVNLSDPNNLIEVVLHGISASEGIPGLVMPSFARALSDADIARIAAYLRRTRTNLPPWPDLDKKVAAIRGYTGASQ